jgi:hypothetical protein
MNLAQGKVPYTASIELMYAGDCFCETMLRKHLGKTYTELGQPRVFRPNIGPLGRRTFCVSEQCTKRVVDYLRGKPSLGTQC